MSNTFEHLPTTFAREDIGTMVLHLMEDRELREQGLHQEADQKWFDLADYFHDSFSEHAFEQLAATGARELHNFEWKLEEGPEAFNG